MIADDEVVIIRGLKKIIDWEALDIEIIGEATNGEEAERLIMNEKPDLAILDICMPTKSGLEILKKVSEKNIKTKIIFLSGYDDFIYVQEAIKYDAVYYLLKPVDTDELMLAVESALGQIRKEKKVYSAMEKLIKIEQEDGYVKLPDTKNKDNFYTALSISIKDIESHDSDMTRLYMFSIFSVIDNYISTQNLGMAFTKTNTIFVVLNHEKDDNSPVRIAKDMIALVKNTCNNKIIVGVGLTGKGISETKKAIATANHALNYRFLDVKSNVFVYGQPLIENNEEGLEPEDNVINQVLDLVAKHYSDNITLDFIAKEVHMNAYYLSTYFKKHTGMNFKDYLTKLRMSEAVKILNKNDIKTYELAERVGFTDARYFSALFKKHYGKTPNEFKDRKVN